MFSYLQKQTYRRPIALVLIIAFIVPSVFFLAPQKAEAVPVVEIWGFNPKEIADGLLWAIVKTAAHAVLQSIVVWAQSGFNGNPVFVQDPEGFLKGIGDEAAGLFIETVAPFLCEPFRAPIQQSLVRGYSRSFYDKINCTLTDVTNNIEGLINGNSPDDGLNAWLSMTQNDQNNPFGAYLLAEEGMSRSVNRAQSAQSTLLDYAMGYLSQQDAEGNVITPGQMIADQLNRTLDVPNQELIAADEIQEVIVVVLTQLVLTAFTSGGGFSGSGLGNIGGGFLSSPGIPAMPDLIDPFDLFGF